MMRFFSPLISWFACTKSLALLIWGVGLDTSGIIDGITPLRCIMHHIRYKQGLSISQATSLYKPEGYSSQCTLVKASGITWDLQREFSPKLLSQGCYITRERVGGKHDPKPSHHKKYRRPSDCDLRSNGPGLYSWDRRSSTSHFSLPFLQPAQLKIGGGPSLKSSIWGINSLDKTVPHSVRHQSFLTESLALYIYIWW